MHLAGRKIRAIGTDALVCRKLHHMAAPDQFGGKRLGREQMAAGSPSGEKKGRCHARSQVSFAGDSRETTTLSVRDACGRRLVSASTKPMDSAVASSEEPP